MTDGERQKLLNDLWAIAGHEQPANHAICAEAADELERLEKELKNWRDRCGKAEGAMLRMQSINSDYTRQIIESECEYGTAND